MKKLAILLFYTFSFSSLFSATHTWVGGVSTNWNTAANWSTGLIPSANDDIIINTATTIDVSAASFPVFPSGFNKMVIGADVTFVCNFISPASKIMNFNSNSSGGFSTATGTTVTLKGTTTDLNGVFTNGRLRINLNGGINKIDGTIEFAGGSSGMDIGTGTTLTLNGRMAFYTNSSNLSAGASSSIFNVSPTGIFELYKDGGIIPSGNWDIASKIRYFGPKNLVGNTGTLITTAFPSFGGFPSIISNLEIDISNSTSILTMSAPSNLTIKGNLDVKKVTGGVFRFATNLNNLNVQGNLTIAAGVNVNLNNSVFSSPPIFNISTMLGGSLTVGGNLIVDGNFDLQTTNGKGGDIIVKGDLIANGRIFTSASTPDIINIYMWNGGMKTLTMPNVDAQNIRLSVIKNSMVTLGSSIDTLRGIQLFSGDNKIILGNFDLFVRGEAPVPSNTGITGGPTNFIVTNGTGLVTMTNISNNNGIGKTFHVASANGTTYFYDPVAIVPTSGAATFSVNVKRSITNPVPQPGQVAPLEWMIMSATPAAVADVFFTADATTLAAFTPSNVVLGRWNGATWEEIFKGVTWASSTLTAPALSSFNKFVIGNACSFVPPPTSTLLAASNTRLCGPAAVKLTSTGGSGEIFQWESQAQCTGAWTALGSAVSGTTSVTPSVTTCYRVAATSGACPVAYSNIQTVLVDMPAVGGLLTLSNNTSINQTVICPNDNITLELSGYTGKIIGWQRNPMTSPVWRDITDTKDKKTLVINGSSLSMTTFYRVSICSSLGICTGTKAVAYSSTFKISLKAICAPAPPAPLISMNEKKILKGISNAYPSPTNNQITLNIEGASEGDAQIEIVDVTGKTAFREIRFLQEGSNEVSLNINTIANGIYIVRFTDNAQQQSIVKIVKEN
jgi:hypothetical protein